MDITKTKKRIQRLIKVAEESYKKITQLMEKMEQLQRDLETTSEQVDHIEYELAEQRALLEAVAEQEGVDVEAVLAEADLPPEPGESADQEDGEEDTQQATSRPSAATDTE
jgi:DNA anti-recombination protein RmuC